MKNTGTTILLLSILLSGLCSCRKSLENKYKESVKNEQVKNTSAIKASQNFKWNTTISLNFSFNAVTLDSRIAILKITTVDGSVVLQKLQKADQDFSVLIEIPVHYEKLIVSFGTISREFETKGGKIVMDLM
ncbi:MAG: hypothetical protein H7296_10340 [Bacteroidia bacterium]|nr:hypothetical protein [Bacteroidia bacterium]